MIHSFSLHKISDSSYFSFDPTQYSRFKFGDNAVAKAFGHDLAQAIISEIIQKQKIDAQIVVISSPYSFIPTATFTLKNQFVFTLNRWLADNGLNVVQETKVQRTITYKEDYGELNAAQRLALIENDSFHIDSVFLKDKTLFFIDDIRITGSHEKMITRMLGQYALTNETYLIYFAELTDKTIHPNIENHLNYYSVKSIFDLNDIIKQADFAINTRIVKYILNSNTTVFQSFIKDQSSYFVNLLYDMAIGNGYHSIEAYQPNLDYIKNKLLFS